MGTGLTASAVKNKNLTIRINANEYRKIKEFAGFLGKPMSEFVMESVWAQIDDWEDIKAAEEYLKEPNQPTKSHADFVKELGL